MANFAVAASPETIEKANQIMEMYAQDGDKKEDILLRILALAESESVKGTHPELEGSLRAVDGTIGVLIKQINGIVAGQDSQLSELKKRLEAALEAKQEITEKANSAIAEAQEKCAAATLQIEQADAAIAAEKEKAKESIEKALADRDQYLRARDDAMAIADEKSASNDLLRKETSRLQNYLNVLNEKYADQCSAMEKAALAQKYQELYASMQGEDTASYDFSGDAYEKLLENNYKYKINDEIWDRVDFGDVVLDH